MSDVAEKVFSGIGKLRAETLLWILCAALIVALFGRDVVTWWRGGHDPDHLAIQSSLASLSEELSTITKSVERNAATTELQAATIDYFVCDMFATGDQAKKTECYRTYRQAQAALQRGR